MKKQMKKNIPGRSPDPRFDTEVTIRAAARRRADTDHWRHGAADNPFAPGSMQFLEYNSQYFGRRN